MPLVGSKATVGARPVNNQRLASLFEDAEDFDNALIFIFKSKKYIGNNSQVEGYVRQMSAPCHTNITLHYLDILKTLALGHVFESRQHIAVDIYGPDNTRLTHSACCSSGKETRPCADVGNIHTLVEVCSCYRITGAEESTLAHLYQNTTNLEPGRNNLWRHALRSQEVCAPKRVGRYRKQCDSHRSKRLVAAHRIHFFKSALHIYVYARDRLFLQKIH